MIRIITVPRKFGRGGAYMRIPVCRNRRCVHKMVRRMHENGSPKHHIVRSLQVSRFAVERILRREVWRG